jgi:NitT/TauT family transport system substrate-binding protein
MPIFCDNRTRHASTIWRLLVVVAVGVLTAVSAAAADAAPVTVRVGIVQAASDAPFFIADKKGYFAEEGIHVDFTVLTDMVPSLATGQLDVGGVSTSAGLFNAAARGLDIKIVADKGSTPPGYDFDPILVRKDLVDSGKVKTFADFKGLKVAGFFKGSGSEVTLNEALGRGGLEFADIDLVYLPFAEQVLALRNKAINASITAEPSATEAVISEAAVRFSPGGQVYPDHQLAVLLYGGDFIKKSPEIAKKFMRAYIKGARDYNDTLKGGKIAGPNAENIISILTETTFIKDPAIYREITANGINPNGHVNMGSLRKDLAFYKAQGMIDGNISVEDVVDDSYVDTVIKELGPYVATPK